MTMMTMMKHATGIFCAAAFCATLPAPAAANSTSRLLTEQGMSAMARRAYAQAQGFCEQAVVADPSDARAFVCLARTHERKKALGKAGKYYGIALSIAPDNKEALFGAATADLRAGDFAAARTKRNRLKRLCTANCGSYKRLNRLIKRFVTKRAREDKDNQ